MSTTTQRNDPCCTTCGRGTVATAMIVHSDGQPVPYCDGCTDRQLEQGGREYPLSAFYEHDGPRTSIMLPDASRAQLFESGAEGSSRAWLEAKDDNPADGPVACVRVTDQA